MRYRLTYEVVRIVESDEPFPDEVINIDLVEMNKKGEVPKWWVVSDEVETMKIVKVVNMGSYKKSLDLVCPRSVTKRSRMDLNSTRI